MNAFILAGALGAIALIVYLLFRRLRRLSWQLTQLRVERDSETILHDIGIRTGSRPARTTPPTAPVRRKRHLSLYLGGSAVGALWLRSRWREHRAGLVASGAAATAVVAAATLYLATTIDLTPPGPATPVPPPSETVGPSSGPQPLPSSSAGSPARTAPLASLPAASPSSGWGGDHAMWTTASLQPPAPPATESGPPRSSPSGGRPPPPTVQPPPEPSAPAPSPSPTPATATLLCVDAETLLELGVCLDG